MFERALQAYRSVADSLYGTEQSAWALVQMGIVYLLLDDKNEAERQFEKAASALTKLKSIGEEMKTNPEGFDRDYYEKLLKWFRNRKS